MNSHLSSNPDQATAPLVAIENQGKMNQDHAQKHCHRRAQLLFCKKGVYQVEIQDRCFLVPPSSAVWIPANTPHSAHCSKQVHFQSLYIDPNYFDSLPTKTEVLQVSTLLKLLIERACRFSWNYKNESPEARLAKVIIDEIKASIPMPFQLALSTHPTLHRVREFILHNLESKPNSSTIAKQRNISSKTLNRLCQREVGMTFEQWRQQIKVSHAMLLLSQGHSTTFTAQSLGYSNDSAFIHMFKKHTGQTPRELIRLEES